MKSSAHQIQLHAREQPTAEQAKIPPLTPGERQLDLTAAVRIAHPFIRIYYHLLPRQFTPHPHLPSHLVTVHTVVIAIGSLPQLHPRVHLIVTKILDTSVDPPLLH